MEILEFEERRGDGYIDKKVKYTLYFGALHLINSHHRRSYREVYDLDIKVGIFVAISLLAFSVLACKGVWFDFRLEQQQDYHKESKDIQQAA